MHTVLVQYIYLYRRKRLYAVPPIEKYISDFIIHAPKFVAVEFTHVSLTLDLFRY